MNQELIELLQEDYKILMYELDMLIHFILL